MFTFITTSPSWNQSALKHCRVFKNLWNLSELKVLNNIEHFFTFILWLSFIEKSFLNRKYLNIQEISKKWAVVAAWFFYRIRSHGNILTTPGLFIAFKLNLISSVFNFSHLFWVAWTYSFMLIPYKSCKCLSLFLEMDIS